MAEFGVMALIVYLALGILVGGFTIGFIRGVRHDMPEPPYGLKLLVLLAWPIICPIFLIWNFEEQFTLILDPVGFVASLVTKAMRKRQV